MNTATSVNEKNPVAPIKQISSVGKNEFAYRSVSKAAVACIVFAVLGALTSFVAPAFVLLPILGLSFGILALTNFRRFPDELTGKMAAKIGLVVSAICLVGSVGYHSVIYATEVPDGYQRISFGDLRPNKRTPVPFSEKAIEFDGKKVFLKGYVRPGAKRRKLKEFVLVGDFGDCCFGGNPKITEVVAITITTDETVDYGYSLRRIGGTFRLNQRTRMINDKDVPQVFYEIEADHVR